MNYTSSRGYNALQSILTTAMPTQTLEQALTRLDAGDLDGARAVARPLLPDPARRADGMYILGRVYQLERKPHTALYLFEQAAARVCPSDTSEYLAECKAQVAASGWTEDFTDRGHTLCSDCRLYYRAEYSSCPYCGDEAEPERDANQYAHVSGNETLGWDDDLLDKAEKAGREVIEKARGIADSKPVKEMGERAKALGKETAEKARAIAEREEVKRAAQRAKELGKEAGESVRKLLDTETAKGVQETARETGQSLAQHVRSFVDEERTRYQTADEARRRAIVVKWALIAFAALVVLQILSWIL